MESKGTPIMFTAIDEPQSGSIVVFDPGNKENIAHVWPEYEKAKQAVAEVQIEALSKEGRQLVHDIYVRKGNQLLMNKAGTRMKPMAQTIFSKNMAKLRAGVSPVDIIADLEAQLKLI